jgi:hypothetical protein
LINFVSGFQAVEHEPSAQPETVKKLLLAQAFQPVLGQPGAAVLHIRRNFSKQLLVGLWPTRKT